MSTKPTAAELQAELQLFSGSTEFYRHGLMRRLVYTEGVQHLAERAGAHWLIDAVASHQGSARVAAEAFQVWTLEQNDDGSTPETGTWTLSCTDGDERGLAVQQIEYSDFPMRKLQLFLVREEHPEGLRCTLLLPSEY